MKHQVLSTLSLAPFNLNVPSIQFIQLFNDFVLNFMKIHYNEFKIENVNKLSTWLVHMWIFNFPL